MEKLAAGGVIGGVLGSRGDEIHLPAGQRLEVRLARDADLSVARR